MPLVTPYDAPGVSNPFSWVTDIGGSVDPVLGASIQLSNIPSPIFSFTLTTTYYTQSSPADNALTGMTFNRLGIMGGPHKHQDGSTNVGGIITLSLWQGTTDQPMSMAQGQKLAEATIDLTSWVPGQFYWSNPLANLVTIWGRQLNAPGVAANNFLYDFAASCPVPYSIYFNRPVTLLNGKQWGQRLYNQPNAYAQLDNGHFAYGSVDIGLNTFKDLGTASLVPNVALAGELHRKAGLSFAGFSPQVMLGGQVSRRGVFEGVSAMAPEVILSATPMVGGPLWKPSRLCTG